MTPKKLAPPATLALFSVTVATYLVQVGIGGIAVPRAIGLIPARISDPAAIMAIGGGQLVPAWLTLVTYILPHAGWWHISTNMAGLWFLGRYAEPAMGTGRFALAYLASGVVTGLIIVGLIPHWTGLVVGASGAICGTLGAFLALQLPRRPVRDHRNLAALAIESACLIGVAAWLIGRTPTARPDRWTSLMWHLLPFLAGWAWARAWRQFASGAVTDQGRPTSA